ncbi:DNA invertase Pin-like site-specific DNA recombinase [Anoxybacillus mongoliensis]|uniref:DNA invertase Pin-like site-specific DNA recombinase n=1 Tax=Anoxybacillus mongoliensis TaxID=452565 RepID=A0A7W8JGM5_9BACL|nr:recombinase family protein [Anoxybacillus mongoliensis]MBB5356691.1 DNA invertase Pin-like site-specific DNA recombinase [Anoxybacillus mongoliensis]
MYRPTNLDVFIYLRKSRKDIEEEKKAAESGASYDTLQRHRDTLLAVVRKEEHNIIDIFEEVVSGESIAERPEIQKLLREVESGVADAVLVMDIDRLGRGDMLDQGILDRAFRYSGTKIITPTEVYDPESETWELVFGIKSLVAREELKTITKRMQHGRRASAAEGKSISKKPPYGYLRDENLKLYPDPETAWVVVKIFEMMRDGHGRQAIAAELDKLGVKPPDEKRAFWSPSSITAIVKNEVYMGHIIWGKVKYVKQNGKYKRKKMPQERWHVKENAHEPLVSKELWEAANKAHTARWRPSTVQNKSLSNPLAGLLKCEICGYTMWYQPRKDRPNALIRCANPKCKGVQKGALLPLVEERILQSLAEFVDQFEVQEQMFEKKERQSVIPLRQKALEKKEKELKELNIQKNNLHDFLERGIYTIEVFLERQQNIVARMKQTQEEIEQLKQEIEKEQLKEKSMNEYVPAVKKVLEAYRQANDVEKKNRLLKSVLEKATYLRKPEWTKKDQFIIQIYPKI